MTGLWHIWRMSVETLKHSSQKWEGGEIYVCLFIMLQDFI